MSLDYLRLITDSEETSLQFLRDRLCISSAPPKCSTSGCDRAMRQVKHGGTSVWRCPAHKGCKVSLRKGSLWEQSRLSLKSSLELAFLWAYKVTPLTAADMSGKDITTVAQWYKMFRMICSMHPAENPIVIGGMEKVIQLDETLVTRKKAKSESDVPQCWIFGGLDVVTGACFLCYVEDNSSATLAPLIKRHVAPGSIVLTKKHHDGYNGIEDIAVTPAYQHRVVTRSRRFADRGSNAWTSSMECLWSKVKGHCKDLRGKKNEQLEARLNEFVWRKSYGKSGIPVFDSLLLHISRMYPTF